MFVLVRLMAKNRAEIIHMHRLLSPRAGNWFKKNKNKKGGGGGGGGGGGWEEEQNNKSGTQCV